MRIWSLHPKYLDPAGLVALWREALLAQAVLQGRTRAYANHPQLVRFQQGRPPEGLIAEYLRIVHREAERRGYRFDARKIGRSSAEGRLAVTRGQLQFEWRHLQAKLTSRNPQWRASLAGVERPQPHPLFRVRRGHVAAWERGTGSHDAKHGPESRSGRLVTKWEGQKRRLPGKVVATP